MKKFFAVLLVLIYSFNLTHVLASNTTDIKEKNLYLKQSILSKHALKWTLQWDKYIKIIDAFIVKNKDNKAELEKIKIFVPEKVLCTDNAAMIGAAAFYHYQKFKKSLPLVRVKPNVSIEIISP